MTRLSSRIPAPRSARGAIAVGLATIGVLAGAVPADAQVVETLRSPPSNATAADAASVNVGATLTVPSALWAVGIRFYKGDGNTGTHTGTLWSATGQALATATFTAETTTGWQRASFAMPVQLQPATTYTISYLAPHGHYSNVEGVFANGNILRADGTNQSRGVYAYASASAFPTASWHDTNYFVSVITRVKQPHRVTTPPPPPPPGDWPANPPAAGTPAGITLTPMAGTTVTTPGTVIDGRSISGTLTVAADNVVIRNSRVTA